MISLIVALTLMLGTVALASRWATAKDRRLRAEAARRARLTDPEEWHARHHR
jgi:hypothetical protein